MRIIDARELKAGDRCVVTPFTSRGKGPLKLAKDKPRLVEDVRPPRLSNPASVAILFDGDEKWTVLGAEAQVGVA